MALGFDVARLRRRVGRDTGDDTDRTRVISASTPPVEPMMECPKCGRCEEAGVATLSVGRNAC